MHTERADAPSTDRLQRLADQLAHVLPHALPAQAPIRDFVHHNTLHAFQHLPFRQAVAQAHAFWGHAGYLPEANWQTLMANGRISDDDLRWATRQCAQSEPDLFDFPTPAGVDVEAFRGALVRLPAQAPDAANLQWQIEEHQQGAIDDALWTACCATVAALPATDNLQKNAAPAAPAMTEASAPLADRLFQRFAQADDDGRVVTWREVLLDLSGFDLMSDLQEPWVRLIASALDDELTAWPLPHRERGLFAAWRAGRHPARGGSGGWRASPRHPHAPADTGAPSFSDDIDPQALIEQLPETALACIAHIFDRYGLPETQWTIYLTRLALRLPGWFGMLQQKDAQHAQSIHATAHAGATPLLFDGLAILLAMEYTEVSHWAALRWGLRPQIELFAKYFNAHPAELIVRHAAHQAPGTVDELLRSEAHRLIQSVANLPDQDAPAWTALATELAAGIAERRAAQAARADAWALFELARTLRWPADALSAERAQTTLYAYRALPESARHYIRLHAYERHYRDDILGALAANRARRDEVAPPLPAAQLVFCMDDREEGMRRHLEELAPQFETFGAAGFFGLAMRWRGIDDLTDTPLCPVVVTPLHRVRERAADARQGAQRQRRRRLRAWLTRQIYHNARRNPVGGLLAPLLLMPGIFLTLLAKTLAARRFGQTLGALRERFDHPVATRLAIDAAPDAPPGETTVPREGFDLDEQASRVGNFLTMIGLTGPFAPLVAIVGHGSHSLNNPHRSAYDCGACGGKHGGPNARAFAQLANRPQVRERLAQRGIVIEPGTWFVGLMHDTCDDQFHGFDLDEIPASHQARYAALAEALRAAAAHHAQERCRRFASAPARISARAAMQHVAERGDDFSQARPELGHVTNACAVIGRRTLTRGTFFDRRAFLISYDPTADADGKIIESILLAAGPVGAGINLEYYFSTVNNEGYGCSTKVMHNLCGDLGVMEGGNSDLRTGLPRQMIEIHEPMRLLVVCEAEPEILSAIVARQSALAELIGLRWIVVAAIRPTDGAQFLFDPTLGWQARTCPASTPWPHCVDSLAWVRDAGGRLRREALPTALLEAGRRPA